eukprot:4415031-Amphidinium_carterae.1
MSKTEEANVSPSSSAVVTIAIAVFSFLMGNGFDWDGAFQVIGLPVSGSNLSTVLEAATVLQARGARMGDHSLSS